MAKFFVEGPFIVPVKRVGMGRTLDSSKVSGFWEAAGDELAGSRGCYLFAIRAGKGVTPLYVGKATKSFKQECFALHKAHKLNTGLLHYRRGTPILFLVALPKKRGKPNGKAIGGLEKFLIQNALAKNENLLNVQHTKPAETFSIMGVFRGGKGKTSASARSFKGAMGL